MPKTFTDDVATAFPTAIEGPLTIVDPSDHSSLIKVDPSTATIQAEVGARPTRTIHVGADRPYNLGVPRLIGNVLAAHQVGTVAPGGFYAAPWVIPSDMDVAQPSHVRLLVSVTPDVSGSGLVVRYLLGHTRVTSGSGPVDGTFIYDWNVPADWAQNDPRIITIDNGSGATFDAGTFSPGDVVGIRVARDGSAPADTLHALVRIADCVRFDYTASRF